MKSRIKVALVAATAAALIPLGIGHAAAAPDKGNALGKKSDWTAAADEARELLIQTIGDDLPQHPYCRRPLEQLDLMINSSDFVWPNSLTILGKTTPVDINNLDLIGGPFVDPSRKLWWSSGIWLAWRAAVFAEAGQTAEAATAARALMAAINSNPDPGSATPEALALAKVTNWGYGKAYRRSQALLCLSAVLPVAELEPAIRMHANVFLDQLRYPGPPGREDVSNIGMLINLHLLDIADILQDPTYRDVALNRIRSEFPQVFSATGVSNEASSHYHGVAYLGWTSAMFALQNRGFTEEATVLSNLLPRALDASAHFISPTGVPLLYGNARESDALLRPEVDADRRLTIVDKKGGTAFGRHSWTDKKTTSWSAVNRPKRGSHGHYDALAVTWQTAGLPILTDIGQPRYDLSPLNVWARSRSGHNTVYSRGQVKNRYKSGYLRHLRTQGADRISMQKRTPDSMCERQAVIDDKRRAASFADSCEAGFTQNFFLDRGWGGGKVKGNEARFRHSSGQELFVTTSKRAKISVTRGTQAPCCGGLYAIDFDQVVPTTQISITGRNAIDTHFVLGEEPQPKSAKIAKQSQEKNRKLAFRWAADTGKAAKGKKAGKTPKATGYRIQMQQKGGLWNTIDMGTSVKKRGRTVSKLENGRKYRFRVVTLSKKASSFSKTTKWAIPHTIPKKISMDVAKLKGKGAKLKALLKWLEPEDDGGADITGYEVKQGKNGDWKRIKRASIKIPLLKKGTILWIRAGNRAGLGGAFKVKVTYNNKTGKLLVNNEDLTPEPPATEPTTPVPATPPTPPTPAPAPVPGA